MSAAVQTSLAFKTWGGARAGAGRKARSESGHPHLSRPELSRHHPVLTTLRVAKGCWNLRSRRALAALRGAFAGGRDRFGFRLIHYSVQGNHVHLIVEAEGKQSLSSNRSHAECRRSARISAAFLDPFSSVAFFAAEVPAVVPVAAPGTWLLRVGWRDAG
jgi:hypothetical protein